MSELGIQLKIDVAGAIQQIKEFSGKSAQSLETMSGSLGKVESALGGIASAFAFEKIISGLSSVISGAAEAEVALKGMENALKLTGDFSRGASEDFLAYAQAIAETTVFDDDLILSQVSLAKSFNLTNEEAKSLISAAVELSAVTGEDLSSSVTNLGKTFDGSVGKLGSLIPELKGLTKEQLLAGGAAEYVTKRFGGTAAMMGSTYSGSVTKAKNAIGDLGESIGDLFIKNQFILKMIESFRGLVVSITSSNTAKAIIVGIAGAIATLGTLAATLGILSAALSAASVVAGIFGVTLAAALGPITLVAAAIAGLIATVAFFKGRGEVSTLDKNLAEARTKVAELLELTRRLEQIRKVQPKSSAGQSANDQLPDLKDKLQDAQESLRKLESSATSTAERVGTAVVAVGGKVTGLAARMALKAKEEYLKTIEEFETEYKKIAERLKTVGFTDAQKIESEYRRELELVERLYREKKLKEKEFQDSKEKLEQEYGEKIRALDKQRFTDISNNLFKAFDFKKFGAITGKDIGAMGLGGVKSVLGGKEGARSLVSQGGGAVANAFFPGSGEAVTQILSILSQGPEKVQELVREFVQAVPEIVKNIILAVPVLIEEIIRGIPQIIVALSRAIPEVISALIEGLPDIIEALVEAVPAIAEVMIANGPRIVEGIFRGFGKVFARIATDGFKSALKSFADGLMALPGQLIQAIKDGINQVFEDLGLKGGGGFGNPLDGGDGGDFGKAIDYIGDITNLWKLSDVPVASMAPTKSKSSASQSSASGIAQKMESIESMVSEKGSGMITINLQLGEKTLASAIYDLNKRGFRTA